MADDHLSALFAEPEGVPDGQSDPTAPEADEPREPEPEPKEPEPAEPKEPEPKDDDLEPAADTDKRVPLAALREEREKRKELQEKAAADAERLARLEGRFQQLLQNMQRPPEPQQKAPTVDEDPIAVLRQVQEDRQQQMAMAQQAQARKQFEQHIAGFEAQFRPQQPDYDDAAVFLAQRRDQDLIDAGHMDPDVRREIMYRDMATLAVNAMQRGQNPAAIAYNMAKRWGWQPKGQEQQQQAPQQRQSEADQKIEMAQKAQAASGSLSAGGGKAPAAMDVDAVARMSDEEFEAFATNESKWRKIWGE